MTLNIKKKYTIKIPNNVTILYCNKKQIITIMGPLTKKSLKLQVKILILKNENLIRITSEPLIKTSNAKKNIYLAIQGTTTALIKQFLLESSYMLYKKLKLVGVGYRTFDVENFENKLLSLKLGYSHSIFFKSSEKSKIFCLKKTKLFIFGNFYQDITKTASVIRSYKKPEPYKGKGILYENEKINLKEGKKI
jgi:large subunit ribosomal protein L6